MKFKFPVQALGKAFVCAKCFEPCCRATCVVRRKDLPICFAATALTGQAAQKSAQCTISLLSSW